MWSLASQYTGVHFIWNGLQVCEACEALKEWHCNELYEDYEALPALLWGVWLARNQAIFEDKYPIFYVSKCFVILKSLSQICSAPLVSRVMEEVIDKLIPWAFSTVHPKVMPRRVGQVVCYTYRTKAVSVILLD